MSNCVICNNLFENKRNILAKTCSRSCNAILRNKEKAKNFNCPKCKICGLETRREKRAEFCSLKCMYSARRKGGHWNWKGGNKKHSEGYVYQYTKTGRHELQHRIIIEKKIGRKLKPEEVVHHINRIKNDNRIENLLLLPNQHTHYMIHRLENTIEKLTTVLTKSEELLGTPSQEIIEYLERTISSLAKTLKGLRRFND